MTERETATIREINAGPKIADVNALFEEYAATLGIDLAFQGFDRELAGLPGAYVRPDGILLLAAVGERSVGCVAVRRLDSGSCEMKRLYVRDQARGTGLGRALAQAAIDFAKASGYRTMRLDTLPAMATAQAMYRRLGFRDIPPYRYNPVPGTTFMELILGAALPRNPH